jgi:hypothetical protein
MKLPEVTEEQSRSLDVILKVAGIVLAALGFVWTIYTLVDQHNQSRAQLEKQHSASLINQTLEFKKGLWDKRLDVYLKACQEASSVADAAPGSKEFRDAVVRFDQLYYGQMVVVESPAVAKAMRDFQHKCYNVLDVIGSTVTSTPPDSSQTLQTELEMASLKLANTCGESIQEDFGVNDFEKVEEGVDVKLSPLRRRLHANPSPEP